MYGVTPNDPYLYGDANKCPYLCGDHNNTLYLWGHHLVSDRICRAPSKYAMLLYGAHRHALDLSGSSELNYSFYWVCADYKLQTLVAPNLWGARPHPLFLFARDDTVLAVTFAAAAARALGLRRCGRGARTSTATTLGTSSSCTLNSSPASVAAGRWCCC